MHRVVLREAVHRQLADHLPNGFHYEDWQKEACLALWRRGGGFNRYAGIFDDGDRDLHGNVSVQR